LKKKELRKEILNLDDQLANVSYERDYWMKQALAYKRKADQQRQEYNQILLGLRSDVAVYKQAYDDIHGLFDKLHTEIEKSFGAGLIPPDINQHFSILNKD
jgi:chorismate mutase